MMLVCAVWDYRSERGARAFFERWKDSLKWQRLEPYRKFAKLIESHWDGIASYCHPDNKVSLGLALVTVRVAFLVGRILTVLPEY